MPSTWVLLVLLGALLIIGAAVRRYTTLLNFPNVQLPSVRGKLPGARIKPFLTFVLAVVVLHIIVYLLFETWWMTFIRSREAVAFHLALFLLAFLYQSVTKRNMQRSTVSGLGVLFLISTGLIAGFFLRSYTDFMPIEPLADRPADTRQDDDDRTLPRTEKHTHDPATDDGSWIRVKDGPGALGWFPHDGAYPFLLRSNRTDQPIFWVDKRNGKLVHFKVVRYENGEVVYRRSGEPAKKRLDKSSKWLNEKEQLLLGNIDWLEFKSAGAEPTTITFKRFGDNEDDA